MLKYLTLMNFPFFCIESSFRDFISKIKKVEYCNMLQESNVQVKFKIFKNT